MSRQDALTQHLGSFLILIRRQLQVSTLCCTLVPPQFLADRSSEGIILWPFHCCLRLGLRQVHPSWCLLWNHSAKEVTWCSHVEVIAVSHLTFSALTRVWRLFRFGILWLRHSLTAPGRIQLLQLLLHPCLTLLHWFCRLRELLSIGPSDPLPRMFPTRHLHKHRRRSSWKIVESVHRRLFHLTEQMSPRCRLPLLSLLLVREESAFRGLVSWSAHRYRSQHQLSLSLLWTCSAWFACRTEQMPSSLCLLATSNTATSATLCHRNWAAVTIVGMLIGHIGSKGLLAVWYISSSIAACVRSFVSRGPWSLELAISTENCSSMQQRSACFNHFFSASLPLTSVFVASCHLPIPWLVDFLSGCMPCVGSSPAELISCYAC